MTEAEKPKSRIMKYGGGFIALMSGLAMFGMAITEPWWKTLGLAILIGVIWKAWKVRPVTQPAQSFDEARYGISPQPSAASKPKSLPSSTPIGEFFHWPDDQGTVPVYGTRHYQSALKELAGEHGNKRADVQVTAHLIPDPKNEHDDKAIRVDVNGKTVGHLSRDDARSFRRRLGAKKIGPVTTTCTARVWGGFDRNNEPRDYGVDLFIKSFGA